MKPSGYFMAAAALLAGSLSGEDAAASVKQEKCYGIVKAGQNDCASANGAHACAALAKRDNDPNEWIMLPDGVCDRITRARTTPPRGSNDG